MTRKGRRDGHRTDGWETHLDVAPTTRCRPPATPCSAPRTQPTEQIQLLSFAKRGALRHRSGLTTLQHPLVENNSRHSE